ncbi:MAG: glycosyltransferase family 1 protein [Candidatus Gastranaerophilales bacterium]|nr:glycosyltransferase family 1 protein [Candidatus Gastranaerophilales bacterium]
MAKILGILPHSIGGRLTTSSILDGFKQNGFKVVLFDELKDENFLNDDYSFIVGYDFSPIKFKIENNLNIKTIAYFSDEIDKKTAGEGYLKYQKYLKNKDIFAFYWDRELSKKENLFYQPHFVNTKIYKNFKKPIYDVMFMGRLDTSLRLKMYLDLNKKLPNLKFCWHAIEKHYLDALSRTENEEEKDILKNTYQGFIDNENDMASAINNTKIVYNINAQGKSSLNYRTIQTMASQRLLITDERAELDLFENILPVYQTTEDLIEKIKYYLGNDEEYEKITKKSREFIELNHDSAKCVLNMLNLISKIN